MRYQEIIEATLPDIKTAIGQALERDDLADDERNELLDKHGILDDMQFDDAGNLMIYRAMYVTLDWIKRTKPGRDLGIYWSHDPNTASPYDAAHDDAGRPEVPFLIEARLAAEYVYWDSILHFHPHGENEVRLEPKTPLTVTRVWVDRKPVKARNWNNQTYRA